MESEPAVTEGIDADMDLFDEVIEKLGKFLFENFGDLGSFFDENSSNGNEKSTRYDPRTIAAADFSMQELQSLAERSLDQITKMLQDRSKYMSDLENTFRESYPTSSNFYNQTQTNMDSIENKMNI